MALTENFYDQETGELIEIKNDRVVARHQSILPPKERTIVRDQFQVLERCGYMGSGKSVHYEEPLVQPEMYPSNNPVANDGPLVQPVMTWDQPKPNYSGQGTPTPNQQEEPLVAPVMTWD